jgi:hypothetical protein
MPHLQVSCSDLELYAMTSYNQYRIRRVKCDEKKPYCFRCTSTGRTCDGYSISNKARQFYPPPIQIQTSFDLPLSLSSGDPRQLRVIHLFCHRTANRMSENFEEDTFWKRSAPQLAHSEPAVFHALLAVNIVFEQAEQNKGVPVQQISPFAIESYNKAIQYVIRKDSLSNSDVYVSLVVCVLFVCLEFMRGDMSLSLRHIQGGFRILTDRNLPTGSGGAGRAVSPGVADHLISDLSAMLSRLRVQTILFDPSLLPLEKPNEKSETFVGPIPLEFSSLAEARSQIANLGAQAMGLIYRTSRSKYSSGTLDEHLATQARLEVEFQQWRRAFENLVAKRRPTWRWQQVKAANIQLMQAISMSIWISTCVSPEQSAFDVFRSDFQTIINLAVETVGHGMLSNFQFDMGVIPSLHFVGVKCRWPQLRRQTLDILGSAHWREMLFDSHRAYRAIHRVMEIEEEESGMFTLPTEENRVHWSHLSLLEAGAIQQKHTLALRPNGVMEPPVVWEEFIPTWGELPPFEPWIDPSI